MGKKDMTEKEMFLKNRKHIFTIENKISQNELTINELDEIIPGYIHTNRLSDMSMTYVSHSGCNLFCYSNEDIVKGFMELTEVFVDMDFMMNTSFSSLFKFSKLNDFNSTFSFFEKIRLSPKHSFELYCTDIKIIRDNQELICITNPVSKLSMTTKRLKGILAQNKFFDDNFRKFMSLSKREKEVLALIARGYRNKEICEKLYISNDTVKTHRRHIYKKLDAKHLSDLVKNAHVFRLV